MVYWVSFKDYIPLQYWNLNMEQAKISYSICWFFHKTTGGALQPHPRQHLPSSQGPSCSLTAPAFLPGSENSGSCQQLLCETQGHESALSLVSFTHKVIFPIQLIYWEPILCKLYPVQLKWWWNSERVTDRKAGVSKGGNRLQVSVMLYLSLKWQEETN